MFFFYAYIFLFQLLNTYLPFLAVFNPYTFAIIALPIGFLYRLKKISLKFIALLFFMAVALIIIYGIKFSFASAALTTAKAVQFNFGYLILVPGLAALFSFSKQVTVKRILALTFWIISVELFIEFFLIRILHFSPTIFQHYPQVAHIRIDKDSGEFVADRLLGMVGNASVMGVFYSVVFSFYLGFLYSEQPLNFFKTHLKKIIVFVTCFFMVVSGSAFFSLVMALFIVRVLKKGNLLKNIFLGILTIALMFGVIALVSQFNSFIGNKFSIDYLIFLLVNDDIEGSLPYLLNDMANGFHWYNFIIGTYYFEWGNPKMVIKTVDFFFANLVYEFGLIGLACFVYIFKQIYGSIKKAAVIHINFLNFGFLVLVIGSLHYPSIVYLAPQVFISTIVAVALRDQTRKYDF